MARRRTEAAARTSRANGARSNGPVSAAGKAASARNARKHGLFASTVGHVSTLSPADIELLDHLRSLGAGAWGGDRLIGEAVQALDRLGRVILLIELASSDVDLLLAHRRSPNFQRTTLGRIGRVEIARQLTYAIKDRAPSCGDEFASD